MPEPVAATATVAAADRLTEPAMTASPARLATAAASPVSRDSSTSAISLSRTPSAGKALPAATLTRSPAASAASDTASSLPSARRRRAVTGSSLASASVVEPAWWRATIST